LKEMNDVKPKLVHKNRLLITLIVLTPL